VNRSTGDSWDAKGLRWASVLLVIGGAFAISGGCTKPADALSKRAASEALEANGPEDSAEEWFNFAVSNLSRFDEFEPTALLRQIVDRLNRWSKAQTTIPAWQRDPLLDTLPDGLAKTSAVQDLETIHFTTSDGVWLREAAWLRDLSRWARGPQADGLARARRLFDWSVRNVQVVLPDTIKQLPTGKWLPQHPWQTLLRGEGTAWERAWVFILLCRSQGIDAAVLGVASSQADASPEPWAVGVRIDRKIYVFEPVLGLALPASDGVRLDESARLDIVPATLEQAAADDRILRRFDVDSDHRYPIKAEQLKRTVVLAEASPWSVSRRMKLVEAHMAGEKKLALTVDASGQASRWKACPQVADVRLWDLPYVTVERQGRLSKSDVQQQQLLSLPFERGKGPELWKARLRYLRGDFLGDEGAIHSYQIVRPADEDLGKIEGQIAWQYFERSKKARPGQSEEVLKKEALQSARVDAMAIIRAKMDATYVLGLIAFERGDFTEAIEYFGKRTVGHTKQHPWKRGAYYNLGRSYEAADQYDRALVQYRIVDPADPGMELRAQWLEKAQTDRAKKPAKGKAKS
jgi:tetratricopeptide (TPR) repeat protein